MPVVFTLQTDYVLQCRINGGISGIGDSVEPDTGLKATFEFSDYVRDLPVLNIGFTTPAVHSYGCPAIAFIFSESYGTPPEEHNKLTTDPYRIISAKIPAWKWNRDIYNTINDAITGQYRQFMTWYPNIKRKVIPGETIHLYFLVINSSQFYLTRIRFVVMFTDGTNATFMGDETPELNDYDIVQMDASPAIVESWTQGNHPDKTVNSYTVQAVFPSIPHETRLSEIRTYVINRIPFNYPRQLFFRNSFGTFDQLMLRGLGTVTATADRISANRQSDYDTVQVPDRITWYNEGRQKLVAETGYLLHNESDFLAELLISKEIYELQNGIFLPIEMQTDKVKQHDDDNALISISFEFEYLQTPIIEMA
jgi:hypothetical protein